jgi:hypothetical protein
MTPWIKSSEIPGQGHNSCRPKDLGAREKSFEIITWDGNWESTDFKYDFKASQNMADPCAMLLHYANSIAL